MKATCPFCRKAELDFVPTEMPADHAPKEPWVLLAEHCPECGWRPAFGRFKTKKDAEGFAPPKVEKAA